MERFIWDIHLLIQELQQDVPNSFLNYNTNTKNDTTNTNTFHSTTTTTTTTKVCKEYCFHQHRRILRRLDRVLDQMEHYVRYNTIMGTTTTATTTTTMDSNSNNNIAVERSSCSDVGMIITEKENYNFSNGTTTTTSLSSHNNSTTTRSNSSSNNSNHHNSNSQNGNTNHNNSSSNNNDTKYDINIGNNNNNNATITLLPMTVITDFIYILTHLSILPVVLEQQQQQQYQQQYYYRDNNHVTNMIMIGSLTISILQHVMNIITVQQQQQHVTTTSNSSNINKNYYYNMNYDIIDRMSLDDIEIVFQQLIQYNNNNNSYHNNTYYWNNSNNEQQNIAMSLLVTTATSIWLSILITYLQYHHFIINHHIFESSFIGSKTCTTTTTTTISTTQTQQFLLIMLIPYLSDIIKIAQNTLKDVDTNDITTTTSRNNDNNNNLSKNEIMKQWQIVVTGIVHGMIQSYVQQQQVQSNDQSNDIMMIIQQPQQQHPIQWLTYYWTLINNDTKNHPYQQQQQQQYEQMSASNVNEFISNMIYNMIELIQYTMDVLDQIQVIGKEMDIKIQPPPLLPHQQQQEQEQQQHMMLSYPSQQDQQHLPFVLDIHEDFHNDGDNNHNCNGVDMNNSMTYSEQPISNNHNHSHLDTYNTKMEHFVSVLDICTNLLITLQPWMLVSSSSSSSYNNGDNYSSFQRLQFTYQQQLFHLWNTLATTFFYQCHHNGVVTTHHYSDEEQQSQQVQQHYMYQIFQRLLQLTNLVLSLIGEKDYDGNSNMKYNNNHSEHERIIILIFLRALEYPDLLVNGNTTLLWQYIEQRTSSTVDDKLCNDGSNETIICNYNHLKRMIQAVTLTFYKQHIIQIQKEDNLYLQEQEQQQQQDCDYPSTFDFQGDDIVDDDKIASGPFANDNGTTSNNPPLPLIYRTVLHRLLSSLPFPTSHDDSKKTSAAGTTDQQRDDPNSNNSTINDPWDDFFWKTIHIYYESHNAMLS